MDEAEEAQHERWKENYAKKKASRRRRAQELQVQDGQSAVESASHEEHKQTAFQKSGAEHAVALLGEALVITDEHEKFFELQALNQTSKQQMHEMVSRHPDAPPDILKGWLMEEHHARTYNQSAIYSRSPFRAAWYGSASDSPSDVGIVRASTGETVDQCQMKCGTPKYVSKGLRNPDYAGMQKVCNTEALDKASKHGATDRICYGGVQSEPADAESIRAQADKILQDGVEVAGMEQASTLSRLATAAEVGVSAAMAGAALGAASAGLVSRIAGDKPEQIKSKAAEGAFQGSVVAGSAAAANSFATSALESANAGMVAGGVVSGTIMFLFQLRRCEQAFGADETQKRSCKMSATATTGAGTGAAIAGTLLVGPLAGAAFALCARITTATFC
ncbi:unnamed protein product [Symbiodinium natans]|uniref:Uncharacterized protein n=1 Tax=Symbiodinium natans TaxID=878477 RepID=A0A812VF92_9DINO|nr:unnamed protein product [Symbiodinium natans]